MKLLLDTHAFLWLRAQPEKVSQKVLDAYQNPGNSVFLSLVSAWEIQIKQQLGKLELTAPLEELIRQQQKQNDLQILPIELEHILGLGKLPFHHKDPFDRLLIAQANRENAVLVSSDGHFAAYDVTVLW